MMFTELYKRGNSPGVNKHSGLILWKAKKTMEKNLEHMEHNESTEAMAM
jgi:hypothetical protein